MAILHVAFGPSLLAVRLMQCLVGATAPLFVYFLCCRLFDRRVAVVAGAIAAIYPVFLFHEGLIEKSWMTEVLVPAAILALVRAQDRGRGFVLAGVVLGIAAIVRENLILAAPVLATGLWLVPRGERSWKPGRAAALYLSGFALAIAPLTIRNAIVAHDFVLTTAQAGQNLYIGNHAGATNGTYQPPPFVRPNPLYEEVDFRSEAEARTHRTMKPSEVSHFWFGEAVAWIGANPASFLRLVGARFLLFWNHEEIADNHYFVFFADRVSPVLRIPIGFGIVGPLAIVGAVLVFPSRRRLVALYALAAITCVSVSLFFVFDRYRLPIVPIAICFAAAALVWIVDHVKQPLALGGAVTLVAAAAVFCNLHLVDVDVSFERMNLGMALHARGDLDGALRELEEAAREEPELVPLHRELGSVYLDRGEPAKAVESLRHAVAIAPNELRNRLELAYALDKSGDLRGALEVYRAALDVKSIYHEPVQRAGVRVHVADVLQRLGDEPAAAAELRRGLEDVPDDANLLNNLAWLLATATDAKVRAPDEAVTLAERAIAKGSERYGTLAEAHFRRGEAQQAVDIAERALRDGKGDLDFYRSRLPVYRAALAKH
ncbi:MAG: glycosyltransferase family 39 protein [Planctomycetes bacterium]|nr:glycosyltransferase family 39 protein [Planctomycetota bacterium]MBI3846371.1 glycosyltransferase family 39 protein [Planctomycetota bacterium]